MDIRKILHCGRSFSYMLFGLLLILSFYSNSYGSQEKIVAIAKIDTNAILIGEHAQISIEVRFQAGRNIDWPLIPDTITKQIEIIERSGIDTSVTTDGNIKILKQIYTVTSFDSGYFVIPPFRFCFTGDTVNYSETEPLLLSVFTVKVDTSLAIKDIKSPLGVPFSISEVLPYAIPALIAVALIILGIYLYKKYRKKPEKIIIRKPKIPPHITALRELEKLENEKLWQQNKIKLYHSMLTEIVRSYIEHRFNVVAMELTTAETIQCLKNVDLNGEINEKLKQLLYLADMVKFAKAKPIASEHELSFKNAVDFVKETIPVERMKSKEIIN